MKPKVKTLAELKRRLQAKLKREQRHRRPSGIFLNWDEQREGYILALEHILRILP